MISKTLRFKERILQIVSAGNGTLYVLSPTKVYCFSKEGKEKDAWNLDSPPRGNLLVTIHGWGIVCQNHIRTASASRYHGLDIVADRRVKFVGEHLRDYKGDNIELENEKNLFVDENTDYVWSSQLYTPQLAKDLKDIVSGVEDGTKVITVKNSDESFGKIVVGTFISGNMLGTLVRIGNRVFRYSLSGVERKPIATIQESRVDSDVLLGTIMKHNIFALGWNEDNAGVIMLMQIDMGKKLKWYLKAVIGFFFLICLISLVFGI